MSTSVINYLSTLKGCPTDSLVAILKYMKHIPVDASVFNNHILQAVGVDISEMPISVEERRYLFFYTMQVGWHSFHKDENLSDEEVFERALSATNEFFSQPYIRSAILAETTERRNKLSKGELAYELYCDNVARLSRNELIALISDELETSKAGATTYYYNAKKKFGEN